MHILSLELLDPEGVSLNTFVLPFVKNLLSFSAYRHSEWTRQSSPSVPEATGKAVGLALQPPVVQRRSLRASGFS